MSQKKKRVPVVSALAAVVPVVAFSATGSPLGGSKVDNFMLADQTGMGHELYYYNESAAIVIVSMAQGDAVSARAATALAKVRDGFKDRNVTFLMLDSSLASDHSKFTGVPGSADQPVLADELQLVGRALGVTTTAEVFLIDTRTCTIAYHGPIDGSFARKKDRKATLTTALNAVLAGKTAPVAEAAVKGTPVDFPDRARTGVRQHRLRHRDRADPRRQVRGLPHAGRPGSVRDEHLRRGQRLLTDDS
jgi:hypothetical protein